jgi:hypothetical protein
MLMFVLLSIVVVCVLRQRQPNPRTAYRSADAGRPATMDYG